jgi:hypothetical protein
LLTRKRRIPLSAASQDLALEAAQAYAALRAGTTALMALR